MAGRKPAGSGNQPLGGRVMTLEEAAREVTSFPVGNPVADPGLLDTIEDDAPSAIDLAERTIAEIGASEQGATGKVQVWRHRDGKRETFMYECEVQDWASQGFAYIRDTYGTGTYRVRVYAGGHMRVNRLIDVEAPSVEPSRAVVQQSSTDDTLRAIGAMMAESMRQMGQMVQTALAQRADESQQMTRTLEMVRMMREAFGMNSAPVNPLAQLMPMLEAMRAMKELQGDIANPGGDTWLERAAEKFLPALLSQSPALTAPASTAQPPAPSPSAPSAPAPSPAQPQQSEEEMYKLFLKRAMGELVAQAARNADVEPIAQEIADKVPDQFIAELCDNPQWFTELSKVEPEMIPFRPWFERLRDTVDKLTAEENPGTSPSHGLPQSFSAHGR